MNKKIGKDLLATFAAQIISILVNFILNIIVPKHIDEYQYAYWQTFVLYFSYVGVLHFGLLDGLILRYAQYDFQELDHRAFRSQFRTLLVITGCCSAFMLCSACFFANTINKTLIILLAIGTVSRNVFTYNAYAFQITNRIQKYALINIFQKLLYGSIVVIFLLLKSNNWILFCLADLFGDTVGIVCCFTSNRELCVGPALTLSESVQETKANISSGIRLLFATWSSMFLVGGAKMVVQWRWNSILFGKITFSFSIISLFLTFINAVSVVLFPILKRMEADQLPILYKKMRDYLSLFLFSALLLYFPMCTVLERWLPKYNESLYYLGFLLPTVVFTSKVNLLTNNYLKAYRKEEIMLRINLVSMGVAFFVYLIGAYIFDSVHFVIIGTVAVIAMRSIISEIEIMKITRISLWKDFAIEVIVVVLFILSAALINGLSGIAVYGCVLIAFVFTWKRSIKSDDVHC